MTIFASWVHGNAVIAENRDALISDLRQGFFATITLRKNSFCWFHVPLPTPAIAGDIWASLDAVHFLYDAQGTASLVRAQAFNGPDRIANHPRRDNDPPLDWRGDHSRGLDNQNGIEVKRRISWGVGLTLLFAAGELDSKIIFTSFGGDFRHDND